MVNSDRVDSTYRWVMLVLILIAVLGQTFVWLGPAPLLTVIVEDLQIDFGSAGKLLTIITLMIAIFNVAGSFVIDRLGLKRAMALALFVIGIGTTSTFFVKQYSGIFIARMFVGMGIGLAGPVLGALIMGWFPPKEQPYINTLNAALGNVGMSLAYLAVPLVFVMVKTWQNTLTFFGVFEIAIALLWVFLAKQTPSAVAQDSEHTPDATAIDNVPIKESGLKQAARRKEVWYLAIAMIGVMWTFNTFTTYLPAYFEEFRGMDMAAASRLTSFLPMVGILGGVLCGFLTSVIGLRKPFLWPMMILMLAGAIGSVSLPTGPAVYLCIGLIGFAAAGWSPVFMTIPMELEGANAEMVGGAFAIILGVGFFVSYFVAAAFGAMVPILGMYKTMLAFGSSTILSIVVLILIPETGPRLRKEPYLG